MDFINWRHVFKVDPAKHISDEQLEQLCESGSDALIVGGTDHVTLDAVLDLLARIRRYSVPVVLEISNLESVTPGFDFYFIPTVLNSNQTKWVKDLHHQAIREFGDIMVWEELVAEGYCVVNPDCKAAHVTGANTDLQQDDVVAYARMAENLFRLPIFYLEYSGMYGDPKMVAATKDVLTKTQLFYGGGIRTEEQAQEMAKIADTVVIGNVIYDDFEAALRTVHAVKGISL